MSMVIIRFDEQKNVTSVLKDIVKGIQVYFRLDEQKLCSSDLKGRFNQFQVLTKIGDPANIPLQTSESVNLADIRRRSSNIVAVEHSPKYRFGNLSKASRTLRRIRIRKLFTDSVNNFRFVRSQ